ncbi:MAG: hypothetical protein ACP5IC_01475 [Minisyncoccia bacterium]
MFTINFFYQSDIDEQIANQKLKEALDKFLDQMPLIYKEPLTLSYNQELDYQEISDNLIQLRK